MNKLNIKSLPSIILFSSIFFQTLSANQINKKENIVSINNVNMYYEIHEAKINKQKLPLVLLHGSFGNTHTWDQYLPELSKDRKVITLEFQGHGRTADTDRPFALGSFADDVAVLLKSLEIKKADVLGYSLGGTVAIKLTIDHPELVNKLVVISATHKYSGWSEATRSVFKSMKVEFLSQTPLKEMYDTLSPTPDHWSDFVSKMIKFNSTPYDLGDENIKSITAPTLLIFGDNDGADLNYVANFYKLLGGGDFVDISTSPTSQLAIIPGKNHVALIMDTNTILSYVEPFLNKTE